MAIGPTVSSEGSEGAVKKRQITAAPTVIISSVSRGAPAWSAKAAICQTATDHKRPHMS